MKKKLKKLKKVPGFELKIWGKSNPKNNSSGKQQLTVSKIPLHRMLMLILQKDIFSLSVLVL